MKIRVALVEDDEGTRESLEAMLRMDSSLEVVGVHGTGDAALERIPEQRPDVVLMDIRLPGLSGIEVVGRLRSVMPDLCVLMLTGQTNKLSLLPLTFPRVSFRLTP